MLHIDNLCEFIKIMIDQNEAGTYFPQNREYVETSELVRTIAQIQGKGIKLTKLLNPLIQKATKFGVINKVFGSLVYDKSMSDDYCDTYQIRSFIESIEVTER